MLMSLHMETLVSSKDRRSMLGIGMTVAVNVSS